MVAQCSTTDPITPAEIVHSVNQPGLESCRINHFGGDFFTGK
jgi:hypothetical protein